MSVFEKKHGLFILRDWGRVRMLYEASEYSTHFSAPKPLGYDLDGEVIFYDRLPDGEPLRAIVIRSVMRRNNDLGRLQSLLSRVGAALSDFHRLGRPVSYLSVEFSSTEFGERIHSTRSILRRADDNLKAFHGDFGTANVWVSSAEEIYFFDPIPRLFFPEGNAGLAPTYFDVAQMIADLQFNYPLKVYPTVHWGKTGSVVASFFEGYKSIDPTLDVDLLLKFVRYLSRLTIDIRIKQDRWLTGRIRKALYSFRSRIPLDLHNG